MTEPASAQFGVHSEVGQLRKVMVCAPGTRRALAGAAFLLVLLVTTGASCDPTDEDSRSATAGLPDLLQQLTAQEWVLDRADSSLTSGDTSPVTLRFAADRTLAGMGSCNSYFGPFTIEGDTTIEIGGLGSTRRACAPQVMAAEDEYLTALGSASTVDATDRNRLVLEDGATRLAYRALDVADELIGTWDVVNLARGDAIVSVLPGTEPVLTFDEDGTLSADAGCNTMSSGWSLAGSDLRIDPPAQTRMACDQPPGVMDQEAALGAALTATAEVQIAGDRISLLDADGSIVLIGTRRAEGGS